MSRLLTISHETFVTRTGRKEKRIIVRHPGSAAALPVDERGRVLLVSQYRIPANGRLWEIPAGKVDDGESVLQGAKRELAEETGYRAKRWSKLVGFYPSPGFLAEFITVYLAQDLRPGESNLGDGEDIELRWFKPDEMLSGIRSGKIRDAKTIAGYLAFLERIRSR
ncbi:MAG: NUDIX hydrolase [Bryobacteraceae bacterium]